MKQIVWAVMAAAILPGGVADACSCMEDGGAFLVQPGGEVPRNVTGFPWYGNKPKGGGRLPPKEAFHLALLPVDGPPQPLPFTIERTDAVFPDRTTSERVLAILKPLVPLRPGGSYQLVYEREPLRDPFGERDIKRVSQEVSFVVADEIITVGGTHASIIVGAEKIGPLAVSTSKGSCSTEIRAASRRVSLVLPAQMRKWRDVLLYSTTVDGRGWRPSSSICDDVAHGTSWAGPGQDLLYATCGSDARAKGLSTGTHMVEMEAWIPGSKIIVRATTTVTLTCRRPTRR